jgi:sugar/nucleoside kinase (ribokinase family)
MPPCPDYLVIGHITQDLCDHGYRIGGTATFSALMAHRLGYTVGILTSVAPDVDLSPLPADISIARRPSNVSTTFENLYHDGHRRQFTRSQAGLLTCSDVPQAWRTAAIVHLGPIAQEVDMAIADCFPNALLGLTPQGWMRRWDERGLVSPARWNPPDALLDRADAVILSQEDVGGDREQVRSLAARTRLLVLTAGWKGATVYHGGQVRSFPAPKVREIDPTGAGDIFAAAYLTALHKTRDPWLCARFANCVAARSVERSGLHSIATQDEIEQCRARLDHGV